MQGRTLTTDQKGKFIRKVRLTGGNVSKAAQAAQISRSAAYEHKATDKAFSDAWDEAIAAGADDLEEELRRRAFKGVKRPVFQNGKKVGHVIEYSDNLGMMILKRHKPEYRERTTQDVNLRVAEMTDAELEALARGE